MVVVTLGSLEKKRNTIRNKWKLKGKNVWIEKNLT